MSDNTISIYVRGDLYSGGEAVIDDLKGSGFTTVIAGAVHVHKNGDLIYNDPTFVRGGKYVGPSAWPGQLADLKQSGSFVNRLLFSIGAPFSDIQTLIKSQGTGPDSILYKNFAALKSAIPTIDGIDLDDESLYDQSTTVQFSRMLNTLGYQVTFCPYMEMGFWVDCLHELNTNSPDTVTGFNLQCYAGGGGNTPQPWIDAIQAKMGSGFDAKGFVFPGLWCRNGTGCNDGDCPVDIQSQIANWKPQGIQGGFIWLYEDIQQCEASGVCSGSMDSKAYAQAIEKGLQ